MCGKEGDPYRGVDIPVLPFIHDTDENLQGIRNACLDVGVKGIVCFVGMGTTVRNGSREPFYRVSDRSFSGLKQKYIQTFKNTYVCASPKEAELMYMFRTECQKHGVMHNADEIFAHLNGFPADAPATQLGMFDL